MTFDKIFNFNIYCVIILYLYLYNWCYNKCIDLEQKVCLLKNNPTFSETFKRKSK